MSLIAGRLVLSPSESVGWATLLVTLITSLTGAVVSIINAIRTKEVQKQTTTSNGKTLAHMIEDNHASIEEKVVPIATTLEQKIVPLADKADSILDEQVRVKEELHDYKRDHD